MIWVSFWASRSQVPESTRVRHAGSTIILPQRQPRLGSKVGEVRGSIEVTRSAICWSGRRSEASANISRAWTQWAHFARQAGFRMKRSHPAVYFQAGCGQRVSYFPPVPQWGRGLSRGERFPAPRRATDSRSVQSPTWPNSGCRRDWCRRSPWW